MFCQRKTKSAYHAALVERLENRQFLTAVVVNTVSDTATGKGVVTFTDALNIANASASPTTITFSPAVFSLHKTININNTSLVDFKKPLTITAPAAGVTISGQNISQGFYVSPSTAVTIWGVTFTSFHAAGAGGAFLVDGNLLLNHVTLANSKATYGGAIQIDGSALVSIYNSTLSGNSSTGNGGAISSVGTLSLTNDTFANNSSAVGGALASNTSLAVDIEDVTFAHNSATNGGGAIDNFANGVKFTLANTIVAQNTTTSGDGPDLSGAFTSKGHNLFGVKPDSQGAVLLASDLRGTAAQPLNAKLGALANNGGLTMTLVPQAGSPALGAGSPALVPLEFTADQRGLPRFANGKVDIGAVEVQPAVVTGTVFNDHNASGTKDAGDLGIAGVKVFVDLKKTGVFAAGDPFVLTNTAGQYTFSLEPGSYALGVQPPAGYRQTLPSSGQDDIVTVAEGAKKTNQNFGLTTTVRIAGIVQVEFAGKKTPLAGAKVTISEVGGGGTFTRTTDAKGAYSIVGLPSNKAYKVTLTIPKGDQPLGSETFTTPVLGSGKSDNNVNFTVTPIVIIRL